VPQQRDEKRAVQRGRKWNKRRKGAAVLEVRAAAAAGIGFTCFVGKFVDTMTRNPFLQSPTTVFGK